MASDITRLYEVLAEVLEYPGRDFLEKIEEASGLLQKNCSCQFASFKPFYDYAKTARASELEELYVNTFDVNASNSLDVGYLMFGEDYKRGQCMAEIKVLQNRFGIDCKAELPDHLPNILRLLTKLDYDASSELVEHLVLPACAKMIKNFEESGNVYQAILVAVQKRLVEDYGVSLPAEEGTPAGLVRASGCASSGN